MAQQAFIASIDILKIWDQANWANPEPVSCRFFLKWQDNNPALQALLYFLCHAMNDVTHSTAGDTKCSASNSIWLCFGKLL